MRPALRAEVDIRIVSVNARNCSAVPALPVGKINEAPQDVELHFHYDDLRRRAKIT